MESQRKTHFNILHLEDDYDYTEAFSKELEYAQQYQVVHIPVRNVPEAIKAVDEQQNFDLILIDLKLAGNSSGLEFMKNLQTTGKMLNVPKIVMSDLSEKNVSIAGRQYTSQELYSLGMSKFLPKAVLLQAKNPDHLIQLLVSETSADLSLTETQNDTISGVTIFKSFFYLAVFSIFLMLGGALLKNYAILVCGSAGLTLSSYLLLISLKFPKQSHEQ
ncbi:response regulator [Mucilaginibacter pedocola]|uniref:Response regulatory domain-containing protein n=1 Tax=Mucilaginibacter pedocola TaxID=1792845 RepID=A0A1S9PA50_9SPHI|nr:response regulator [Mucilaginibacter pedocola]OOQ57866.1 hypothetical protein BC343_13910 [Mucilaginibacter pedocola]